MDTIIFLTDYKGHYGSKYDAVPYNSGLDLNFLSSGLRRIGIEPRFFSFTEVYRQPIDYWKDIPVLYTSSEDVGYHYKSFIEDVICYLEAIGAVVVPSYRFLRANNNKVFMELLRKVAGLPLSLKSHVFGCIEELTATEEDWIYPIVIKLSEGAMSETVDIAYSRYELLKKVSLMTKTSSVKEDAREFIRSRKYQGYVKQSRFRKKFILQEFVHGLKADFKVLNFGEKYFCFKRPTRKNDFRASGSGNRNYSYGEDSGVTKELLDYSREVVDLLKLPFVSLDIVDYNGIFHLLEFQALYFGTVGVIKSTGHYEYKDGSWKYLEGKMTVEDVHIHSIAKYFGK